MSTEIIWQVTFVDRLLNLCCASRNRTQSTDVDDHQPHVLPAVIVPIQEFAARRVWYMSFYAINVESPTLVRPAGPWRLVSLSTVLMQGRALRHLGERKHRSLAVGQVVSKVKILARESDRASRKLLEAVEIKAGKPAINMYAGWNLL